MMKNLLKPHSKGEVLRQTRSYKEIAGLSYEEFLDYIQDLNEISRYLNNFLMPLIKTFGTDLIQFFFSHFLDANGKQLVFAVKKGTDSTALWKGTVRVACVKVSNVNECKSFSLFDGL